MRNQCKAEITVQACDIRTLPPETRCRILQFQKIRRIEYGNFLIKEIRNIQQRRNAAAK